LKTVFSYKRYITSSILIIFWLGILLYRYFVIEYLPTWDRTLWIIDTSLSMAVEDIPSTEKGMMISRLDLAKKLALLGIESIWGEHAVISYARQASVESPFLSEKAFTRDIVSSLSLIEFYGWSDSEAALSLARTLYAGSSVPIHIVVLTDGEMTGEKQDVSLPENLDLTFVALGSSRWGKIPLGYDAEGERRYKYFSGSQVVVSYDPISLKKLAGIYDAQYIDQGTSALFPASLIRVPITQNKKNIYLLLATLLIVSWYIYHPYAQKHP
jgi:von Willebrand factor type A domain